MSQETGIHVNTYNLVHHGPIGTHRAGNFGAERKQQKTNKTRSESDGDGRNQRFNPKKLETWLRLLTRTNKTRHRQRINGAVVWRGNLEDPHNHSIPPGHIKIKRKTHGGVVPEYTKQQTPSCNMVSLQHFRPQKTLCSSSERLEPKANRKAGSIQRPHKSYLTNSNNIPSQADKNTK